MNKLKIKQIDLDITLLGGQSFCWDRVGDGEYVGFMNDRVLRIEQKSDGIYWQSYPTLEDSENFVSEYFRTDVDFEHILNQIQKDEHIKNARKTFAHIRLLKQNLAKTIMQFVISSNCNIKSIRYRVRKLAEMYGDKVSTKIGIFSLFPKPEAIANANLQDLLNCSLGYRAKYLKQTCEVISDDSFLQKIQSADEKSARKMLMQLPGVGPKVADCILVYGLGFDNVFPMDLWGQRVVKRLYGLDQNSTYDEMRDWIAEYFGGFAGWGGQYLFEYMRAGGGPKIG